MVIGIGTDILKMDQIFGDYLKNGDSFLVKTYTDREQAQAEERSNKAVYYATRFAGKEAVFKTLNRSGERVLLKEIEILNNENGQPFVILHGAMKERAKELGISNVQISLSYDTDYATAFAVAQ